MTQAVTLVRARLGPWPAHGGRLRDVARRRWAEATPRTRVTVQVVTLLAVVVVAYNYSLSTLVQNAGLETPLAYVSLVPAIALALAAIRAHPVRPEPAIFDRQVDYIVGLPLIGVALAANLLLPQRLSAMFWVWRVDLLTLPVFVAGATAIIFGVRALWRQKLAVGYLFLAWPYPYQSVLLRLLNAFTAGTLAATRTAVKVFPVAKAVQSPDGTLFVVHHHGSSFPVSIVTACSGVNGVVGFLLVGSAFAAIVRGPLVRKLLWLVGGMTLLWVVNLGRVLFIFWAGRLWGEHVAIDVLHPFVGLLTFGAGVTLMILLIRPLGMQIGVSRKARSDDLPMVAHRQRAALAVPKVYAAIAIVTVAAAVLGLSNFGLKTYNLVANASGQPRLTSFVTAAAAPPGWRPRRIATFDWARPLFGDTSIWNRYSFVHVEGGNLSTPITVIGDAIVTPDLGTFSAYGVEACYQFHGYALRDIARVDVGGGIVGQAMSYRAPAFGSWSIVYWIIPVKVGRSTDYERMVLYVRNTGTTRLVPGAAVVSGISNLAGRLDPSQRVDAELIDNRSFLVAFAREMIRAEASNHRITPYAGNNDAVYGGPGTSTAHGGTVDPAINLSST